jgi:hypothetical protein
MVMLSIDRTIKIKANHSKGKNVLGNFINCGGGELLHFCFVVE